MIANSYLNPIVNFIVDVSWSYLPNVIKIYAFMSPDPILNLAICPSETSFYTIFMYFCHLCLAASY